MLSHIHPTHGITRYCRVMTTVWSTTNTLETYIGRVMEALNKFPDIDANATFDVGVAFGQAANLAKAGYPETHLDFYDADVLAFILTMIGQ